MNWSYFKPEFSGKPEEDPQGHFLKILDWIDTHNFPAAQSVRRFTLTLAGEARLWYQSIHPFHSNWEELQDGLELHFLRYAILENSCFMHGDQVIMMKIQR